MLKSCPCSILPIPIYKIHEKIIYTYISNLSAKLKFNFGSISKSISGSTFFMSHYNKTSGRKIIPVYSGWISNKSIGTFYSVKRGVLEGPGTAAREQCYNKMFDKKIAILFLNIARSLKKKYRHPPHLAMNIAT